METVKSALPEVIQQSEGIDNEQLLTTRESFTEQESDQNEEKLQVL